jgi:hypothetical protein
MPRITALYATPVAIPPTRAALRSVTDAVPGCEVLTTLDEALLRVVLDDGAVSSRARDRLATHLRLAVEAGSDAVLVTCNIYSPVLHDLRAITGSVPVLAIDDPMVRRAVDHDRIAVVATGRSGLESQLEMIQAEARRRGREVTVTPYLVAEAFAALTSGEEARHDRLVLEAVAGLDCDVVVLAQASMARVLDSDQASLLVAGGPPVLSSPPLAARELVRLVDPALRA